MEERCQLCGRNAKVTPDGNTHNYYIRCETCGLYIVGFLIRGHGIENYLDSSKTYILSALTRRASDAGNPIAVTSENIDDLLGSITPPTPLEQMDRALLMVDSLQERADQAIVPEYNTDYPLVFARDGEELRYFLETLVDRRLLETSSSPTIGNPTEYHLTPEGWSAVEQLRKSQPDSSQAFVAMWFADELKRAWGEGFKPALETMGFTPIRIDLVQHNDKIDDRIVAEIRRSGLLIADLTGNRGGVYFEAGFAMGLSIPVIWTCEDGGLDEVHFDTRQYNFIEWKDPQELAQKLEDRIAATIPGRQHRAQPE